MLVSVCNAGDPGSIPGGEAALEKEMAAHSSILVGKSHGWQSLVGYLPRDHKELDTTERDLSSIYILYQYIL